VQNQEPLQQSIQRHESYIKDDAGNVLLRVSLGDLYHQAGRLEEAVATYQQCLRQAPGHPPARSRLASVMITQHRFAEAEKALRELIDAGDADTALLHNLGLSLFYQERFEEARKCFADAAERGLKVPGNFSYWARALHHLGSMKEAIDACRAWVDAAQDADSKSYLALLYMDNNDTESGRKLALEVLAQKPDDISANIVVGVSATERQEIAQAQRHFETVLRQDQDNGRAWLGLGLAHLYEQRHAQAIEALGNAVRIYPDNPGIIVALGWAQISARDPAAAEQTFERALRADRSFGESHGGLAAALAMQQKLERAEEEIKIAKRLNRQGFGAVFAQTAVLAIRGDKQAATDVFARALQRAPQKGMLPLIEQLRIYSTLKGRAAKPAKPRES